MRLLEGVEKFAAAARYDVSGSVEDDLEDRCESSERLLMAAKSFGPRAAGTVDFQELDSSYHI